MVAVVTGNGLGLFNSSLNILGAAAGSFGQGNLGQAGGKAWVNASTGNLILRFTDEQLSGQGQDLFHTRTYNTLGALNDADGDGWRWDGERRVVVSGTVFTAGSSLSRTTGDGRETVYTWNGSRYQSTDGDGAHDFIEFSWQDNDWYWTDGTTRSIERYNGSSGLLVSVRDTLGTLITYGYHNGKLSSVSDSSGQALIMVYNDAGQMVRLDTRTSTTGPLTSQVYYVYDGYGRLTLVRTDLTPDDNSIVDGQFYQTQYTYEGSSFRIASVVQSDGTSASFTYELVDGEYRVKTVNDASGLTTFTYVPSQGYTKVGNALNQEWVYTYDANGQLTYVRSPAENGQDFYTSFQYDADGNVIRITDNSGDAVGYYYDGRGNRILERDPQGVTVARTFSASNQILNEIHYSQPATWYGASGTWGEPPASSAQVIRHVYDYADRLRFVVSASGSVAEYRYDPNGLRTREIVYGDSRYDLSGLATEAGIAESTLMSWAAARDQTRSQVVGFHYDYRGNLIQRAVFAKVNAAGEPVLDDTTSITAYVYSQHGQLLQTVALHGATRAVLSSTTYDGMGRVLAQIDESGTRTTVHDGDNRKIAVTTASGLVLTQVYDPLGRLIRIEESTTTGATRGSSYYVYDAAGRLAMKEDATGVRTYTFYDALGRVAAEVDGNGSISRYTYNQKDQRISTLSYATQLDTRNWFSGGAVVVSLAQILPTANAADRLTRFHYDNAGRLFESIDGAGVVTSYKYDGRGQLVRQAIGQRVTRFFFDADGRQIGQLDAEGYLRENVYNPAGQLQQAIRYAAATAAGQRDAGSLADLRPSGTSLSTWSFYDGAGRQIGSVDEQGFVTETVYDEVGNTIRSIRYAVAFTAALNSASTFATVRDAVKNGASQVLITAHDGQGRVLSRTATDGSVTTFEYDAAGRLVRETTAAGTAEERSTRTLYDAFGQTTGKLLGEASGRITTGMSQAQVAAVYSQYGTTWNYDAAGRVASVTDALGNRTLSYYDAAGRLTRVINAVGEVSETKYNAFGDVIEKNQLGTRLAPGGLGGGLQSPGLESLLASIRNANIDSRTTQAWDTRGLLLTSIDAEGISTTNQYDQYGQLQRQIRVIAGSRTVTSAYGYNLRGERISQIRDAGGLNLTDTTAYDAFGRAIRSTDAAGNLSTSEYLDNGRTVVVRDPLNNSRRTELDAFGRTLKEVDTLGNVTLYSYDDVNRSIVVTMPDGTRVSTWKTRHGETLKLVNAKGDATLYEYNREGQLTRTIDALGQAEVKRYDKAGRLSESVDARGVVTHLDYDAANRVVQRSVDPTGLNQRTTYAFDTSGRQISVVDSAGTSSARVTENRYDRNGQLTRTVVDPNGLKLSTHYVYDGLGNVLRVSQGTLENPQQRVTDYVYNAAGQRRLSIDTLGYVTERTYDAAGNVLQETRYSTRYEGSRDAQSLGASGSLVGNSSEDRVTNYAYDALGRQRFSIDALGYVSERAYDSKGNVIEETRYANRYVGSRDAATLQKLGTNRLNNAVFANPGSNGLPAGWAVSSLPAGTTITVNPSNSPTVTPQDLPAGDGLVQVYQNGREGTGSYQEVFQQTLSVSAGERYAFSVYTAAINTHVEVYIAWLDVRGIWFSNTNVAQNLDEVHGGTSLGDYKRLETVGVAPEGAVGARVVIRKSDTLSGHTASQVLLAHPQFEALDPDGSASAWTRPLISSSADDRVTNYAYDALGRQRFSIDALGYVTERSYDATGNVIQEARYANRYAGSRDAATLKQLGSNLLTNANFGSSGSNGVPAGWALSTLSQTISVAVNPGNSPGLLAQDLPVGDGIVQVYQAGRDGTDTYEDLYQNTLQVRGGLRYAFSAYTGVINANAQVYISWLDARGQLIGMSQATAASQNLQQAGGGSRLKDYKRLEAIDVAPANAVTALVAIRKSDTVAGQSNSQLLVTHVQFEALGTGETTSNPWSRPLSTSADDRVTNYLHDALGRQRFSIDALGYVSERNYDAVGNVIQETRYANRYTGSRDAATLQKLGANRLNNAVFANPGSNGLPAGWAVSSLPAGTTITVNPSNSPAVTPLDLPAGDGLVQVYQNGREGTGSYQEVFQQTLSVSAGGRYAFSVYTAAINTNVEVYIAWLDASGKWFENTNVAQNLDEVHGGTSLASYKRLETIGVAPEGAVGARVVIRKSDTLAGHTASQVLLVHPQFEALDPGESTSSVWTRPLVSTSPDDRMTNYVYDALGRQRFSIDALGHVSERSYDEAGNISKETRYANTYTGTRDAATLQAVGTNLLNNAVFASPGGNGVPAGWMVYNLPAGITITVNPANSPIVTAQDLPAGDGLVQVYQDGRIGTGAEQEVFQQNLEVSAGQRYAFSVYTAAINTNVEVFIAWLDASGTWFSTSEVAKNLDEVHGGTSLADYKRLEAIGVAPAGAVSARVVIRKSDTLAGHTASQALLVHPQFEALAPGESVGSAWTRPLVSSSSEDRVSRYVYDALGRQRFAIDALGFVSERVYDGLGNVVQETRYSKALTGPRDAATPHKLETGTLKQTLSGAADRTTWNSYDASGQMVGLLDPLGYTESYTYDAFGNRTSLKNKNGQTWNYRYDRVGQLLEEITPPVMVSTVGAAGQTDTRAAMLVTRNEYNAFGNLISRSEGRLRTHLADDPALDDLGQSRTAGYGYDALGRQVRITSPGWYNKASGQFQQNSDGTANTFQVTTDVTYDSLGNAVRNRVRMNNTGSAGLDYVDSYKAYDLLGQVRYEVDALKGVTVHEYDGFGQETLTRRHAAALNAGVPASGYYQLADFTAASLPRDGVNDRSLFTRYDRLGRKTEVQQDIVSLYSFTGNVATSALKNVAPVKAYGYNSFGEVVHETLLARDISGASVMSQISTVNYYDRAGQRIGSVDAQGYYTRMEYNGSGKVARQVEYANALGAWNESSIPTVQASIRDRSVRFAYDQADRLVQTTQENVTYWQQSFAVPNAVRATMTQVTGDVIVSRSTYDGVGNVRTLTDAAGNITTTEYNALGQVQKVIEPARYSAGNGSGSPFASSAYASPIVYYAVNAFGQVVYEQRSAGEGQAGATQVTRTVYDAAGHEVKEFDAMGSAQSFKVDVAGRRLEESREINSNLSGWRYNVQTIRRTYSYDSLGQQLGASDWYTEGGVQKNTTNSVVYNRFGEITAELLNGNAKSSYVYNQVGNAIQQTNAQGVTQVDYDLTGKASRSVQLGNLATSADDRITYLRNDLLGRVLEQHLPAFEANIGSDTLNGVSLALTTPIIRQTSDRWGNVLDRTDARGYVTRYSYDHNNQVLTETLPETDILRENGTSYRASLIHEKRYDLRGLLIEEADLVSTGGGPLRTRQHAYNAAGQLVRDIDALGASRYYSVDAHGNQVGILDPVGNATFDEYDALNRHTRHGIVRNGQRVTLLTKQYDEAGRVFAEIDGASTVQETLVSTWQSNELSYLSGDTGNTRFSQFDERGNIVATRNESNIQKTFVFNEANRKVAEIDALGASLTWTYNEADYGRLVSHKDLGGRDFAYSYNGFGQTLTDGTDKVYTYHANGLLKSVATSVTVGATHYPRWYSWTTVNTSSYSYDLQGNRTRDLLTTSVSWASNVNNNGSLAYNYDTRFAFNEQGNLRGVKTPPGGMLVGDPVFEYSFAPGTIYHKSSSTMAATLTYSFDEFGNRRRSYMDTQTQAGAAVVIDDWYKYDANDRVTVVQGLQQGGQVVAGVVAGKAKGYTISYDSAGRRASSEQWVGKSGAQEKYELSEYTYNDLNQVATRRVRDIIRQSGANSSGGPQSISASQQNLSSLYDDRGRLVEQKTYANGKEQAWDFFTFRGDGQKMGEVKYTYINNAAVLAQASYFGEANMRDAVGNQLYNRYSVFNPNGTTKTRGEFRTEYAAYESYKSTKLTAWNSDAQAFGITTFENNARGELKTLLSNNNNGVLRRYVLNGDGQIALRREEAGDLAQNYLYYQGGALANTGGISAPAITDTFVPISADYPAQIPTVYQVNAGDTLQKVAQQVWGDARMWYLIADANGVTGDLVAGTALRIPNVVSSTHNTATTFKPYNANEVIGDTITQPQPPKPKGKKCNAVASVVMVVVAVVVAIFTAGAGLALAGGAGLVTAAGAGATAVMAGGIAVGGLAGFAASLGGAVVGSLASQAVGKAMGVVDQISWKQAAVAGLGGGIAAGLTGMAAGASSTIGKAFDAIGTANITWSQTALAYGVQGAAGYAGNYIASKAVGLDTSFSWKNMAASAIGSSIAGSLNADAGWAGSIFRGEVSALSSAWMKDKWFGGGRPDYGQVAADAFGNALVDFAVRSLQESSNFEAKRESDEWIRNNNDEIEERVHDKSYWLASNSDAAIELDPTVIVAEAPEGVLEQAIDYMQKSRIAEQAYLSSLVKSSTNPFGETVGRARRAINAAGYDVVDGALGIAHLVSSRTALSELATNLSTVARYVMDHPGEAINGSVAAASNYLVMTDPAQIAEDSGHFLVSALAGGAVARGATVVAGSTVRATAAGAGASMRAGVDYLKNSVYVPPPSGILYGGIFIPSLGKRITTVSKSMSRTFQGNGYLNPRDNRITAPGIGEVLAVDHIYPVSKIIDLPGFRDLTRSQMTDIIQDRVGLGNLQPLPQSLNSSKSASTKWRLYGEEKLDDDYIVNLQLEQADLENKIIRQIQIFNDLNAGRR